MLPIACTPVNTVPHPYGQGTTYSAPLPVGLPAVESCTAGEPTADDESFDHWLFEWYSGFAPRLLLIGVSTTTTQLANDNLPSGRNNWHRRTRVIGWRGSNR
jgi:hypothetical protein